MSEAAAPGEGKGTQIPPSVQGVQGTQSAPHPKRRRVAMYVSAVDQHLIEQGLPPSWEDHVREEDAWPGSMRDVPDRGDGANDRRLLDNVPPHWQPRA